MGPVDLRRSFQRGYDALADAIDVALTALHLLGALALAASLVATAAGLVFFPPPTKPVRTAGMGGPLWPGELRDQAARDAWAPTRGLHPGQ